MDNTIGVMLARADTYNTDTIKKFIDTSCIRLAISRNFAGKRIVLKPNLISGRASPLACTDGRFIAGVAEWFLDCGARVLLGDSPAFGSVDSVLRTHGISEQLRHLDVDVLSFKTPRKKHLSHGVTIGVSEEALDCDYFINLPKVKAHNQMYVTLAVKNLFGIVCGMRKGLAHMKNGSSHLRFADLMLDLVELLPDSLSIVDGITAMHREGPVSGEPLQLGCMAMSIDPVALDTALLETLELSSHLCPVWQAAWRRNLAGSCLENISFIGDEPTVFSGSGFTAPETLNPVPFNPFRFLNSLMKRAVLKVST